MILIFGEIISDLETPSFGFDKKLIVAKNTGLFKKEGRKKEDAAHREDLSATDFLFWWARLSVEIC